MWQNVTSFCVDRFRPCVRRTDFSLLGAKQVTCVSFDAEDRYRAVCSPQHNLLEGVANAELEKVSAHTPHDRRLESIRVTPVIRAFVTWSCGVGSSISSGRPGEGCSHVRRLPPPRPTTSVVDMCRGWNARMSRQVEERRIQDSEPSRSEMDDVRGAISAGLKLGGPPRMSVGAKERSTG